jgi:hypothetical protein
MLVGVDDGFFLLHHIDGYQGCWFRFSAFQLIKLVAKCAIIQRVNSCSGYSEYFEKIEFSSAKFRYLSYR